jgi:hypothetical protein
VGAVAAVLALLAAAAFALAATLWKRASLSLAEVSFRRPKSFLGLFTRSIWLLGLAAQGVGVVLQGAALVRGGLTIIQPLLVTTVIFAMPLGYVLTGQQITRRQVLGAVVIVLGLALFASFGDPAGGIDNAATSDWISAFLVIGTLCSALMLFASRRRPGRKGCRLRQRCRDPVRHLGDSHEAGRRGDAYRRLGHPCPLADLHARRNRIAGFLVQQISLATGRLVASVATVSVANPG